MKQVKVWVGGASILMALGGLAHAASDGTAEGFQKARAACRQELSAQLGKQSTVTKDEKEMLWKRCMQDHLSAQRK